MNTELKNTNLVKLNEFFKAYAKIDVNKGTFGLYAEAAAKDGKFAGYVKPLIKDLDVVGKEDKTLGECSRYSSPGLRIKQGQVATKVSFEGNVKDSKSNIWYTISELLTMHSLRYTTFHR